MAVLTLNAGSSSLKFALFDADRPLLRGAFEAVTDAPKASAHAADGRPLDPPKVEGVGHEAVLPALFAWVADHAAIHAVGHRIVHGADRFPGPTRVDASILADIEALSPLAPLHQPHNAAAIRAVQATRPDLPQVACFDTAFHQTMPELARRLAIPDRLGMRRYGFHGLSYEWIAGKLPPPLARGRTVVAHLGSGASLCALRAGRSVDTTMSTTPLDGLVMATRCGALDPGVVLALVKRHGADQVEHTLYHDSGLLGVSGLSGDIRALHDSATPAARLAVDLFTQRVAAGVAVMATSLGGIDGLVFTAGIGEHDDQVRRAVCQRLAWLGLALDPTATTGRISAHASPIQVWVIPTDEEAVIARQTNALAPPALLPQP